MQEKEECWEGEKVGWSVQWYRLTSLTPSISNSTWQSSLIHLSDNDLIKVMWSWLDRIGVVIGNNHTLLNTHEAIQADLKAKLCMHALYINKWQLMIKAL